MACTTVMAGRKATNDGSTMIARTEDGQYNPKRMIVVEPKNQPRKYKSVRSHVVVELPDNPMRYTAAPNADVKKEGLWSATGINAANVGMTATETITSNPRVLAADPMVELKKPERRGEKEIPGGIGEEDFVVLVLPYIHSAREGVLRLGTLLEQYGTYEMNGIAFNDAEEVWWMETIGGHHWIARRVPDDCVALAPNQFAMDDFDMEDAFGKKEAHLCSADLREFITENHLNLNPEGKFNPRWIFGSNRDTDHRYNTPRAWFMARYLTPQSHRWDGPDAEFGPESDNIPWCIVPERKIAAEDIQYMLSSHYQGTPYNPYSGQDTGKRGIYRCIGISRTNVTSICQIRPDMPDAIQGVEWISFGTTTFSAWFPVYTNVSKLPAYLSRTVTEVSTEHLYWASRLISVLADHHYPESVRPIERYQAGVVTKARGIIREYDRRIRETGDTALMEKANEEIVAMVKKETDKILGEVLLTASKGMKDEYNLADN